MIKKYVCPHCGGGLGGFRNDMYALQAEIERLRANRTEMLAALKTALAAIQELRDPVSAATAVEAAIAKAEGTS